VKGPYQSRKESILNCLLVENKGFIYKRKGGSDQENIRPLRGGWAKTAGNKIWEWKYGSLFGMTDIARKERQTNGSLFEKTELSKVKNIVEWNRGFWAYTMEIWVR